MVQRKKKATGAGELSNAAAIKRRSNKSFRREHRNAGANVKRIFMGWDRPLLHSAVAYFLQRYQQQQCWDMNHVMVVLPSSLAARRLQQLMAITANEKKLLLRPPQVLTFGDLPENFTKLIIPSPETYSRPLPGSKRFEV